MILSAFALGDLNLLQEKRISNRERSDGLRFVTSWFMRNSVSLQGIHLRVWQKLMIAFEVEIQRKQTAATKRFTQTALHLFRVIYLSVYLLDCFAFRSTLFQNWGGVEKLRGSTNPKHNANFEPRPHWFLETLWFTQFDIYSNAPAIWKRCKGLGG